MLEKSRTLTADQILFDWEDSVAASQKELARVALARLLGSEQEFQASLLSVRINSLNSPWYESDLKALANFAARLTSIVVPKVADRAALERIATDLEIIEGAAGLSAGSIGIDAQVESAIGLVNCAAIASHPRVLSLSFGPLDFLADIGIATSGELGSAAQLIDFALCQVIVGARAHGKLAFDGPVVEFRDLSKFEASAAKSRALGFDGKWVIHPDQIASCNRIYSPSSTEVAGAQELVAKYEAALATDGAIEIAGNMIDEASYRIAQRTLRRSRAFS